MYARKSEHMCDGTYNKTAMSNAPWNETFVSMSKAPWNETFVRYDPKLPSPFRGTLYIMENVWYYYIRWDFWVLH